MRLLLPIQIQNDFELVSQMRRAAVSVPANIVEGFKRRSVKEKLHFYTIAEASLEELKYYFILSQDLTYISDCKLLYMQAERVGRLLYRFKESIQRRR